jgi:hypothetical protein
VFALCAPSKKLRCTYLVILLSVFNPFCCLLLRYVAILFLIIPPRFSYILLNFFTLNCSKYWCFSFLHHLKLTHLIILTTFFILSCCHSFPCVALCFLSFPICSCSLRCPPSLHFLQRAAAFSLSLSFIDLPAWFIMFSRSFLSLKTLESLRYVLPRFSYLKRAVSIIGVFVIPFYICSFFNFLTLFFFQFVFFCISSSAVVRTLL